MRIDTMTEHCPNCDDPLEKVSISGGAFIGWFCYPCEKFLPLQNLDIGDRMKETGVPTE